MAGFHAILVAYAERGQNPRCLPRQPQRHVQMIRGPLVPAASGTPSPRTPARPLGSATRGGRWCAGPGRARSRRPARSAVTSRSARAHPAVEVGSAARVGDHGLGIGEDQRARGHAHQRVQRRILGPHLLRLDVRAAHVNERVGDVGDADGGRAAGQQPLEPLPCTEAPAHGPRVEREKKKGGSSRNGQRGPRAESPLVCTRRRRPGLGGRRG